MGLKPEATPEDVKKAYRRLARRFHPDVTKELNAEAKFKQLGEAYEVLKDPEKRAAYDELRRYGGRPGEEFVPPPGWQSRQGPQMDPRQAREFSDFFEAIFGRGGAGPHGVGGDWPGEDVHLAVQVSLAEAHRGGSRTLTLPGRAPHAGGTRVLKVAIPAGVQPGRQIRLRGQGQPGLGQGRAGDLFLHVEFAPHRLYTVEGSHLTLVLPVAPWEAMLGGVVTVPTLDGAVRLTIPACSQAGRKLRLPGKGLSGNPPGDLFVVLQIVVPSMPSTREEELTRTLAAESRFDPRATLAG